MEMEKEVDFFATWPPKQNRIYYDSNLTRIPPETKGQNLATYQFVRSQKGNEDVLRRLNQDTEIYTDLPKKFLETFFTVQQSSNPIKFPRMQRDKYITVRECMQHHNSFKKNGQLAIDQYQTLGWSTQKAYENWLDLLVGFAFNCLHVCKVQLCYICDNDYDDNDYDDKNVFWAIDEKQMLSDDNCSSICIVSLKGLEFRNFGKKTKTAKKWWDGAEVISIDELLPDIRHYTEKMIASLLMICDKNEITDCVKIPEGLGVFLSGLTNSQQQKVREARIKGTCDALKNYTGKKINFHVCGFFKEFRGQEIRNDKITLVDQTGRDALVIAAGIQVKGDKKEPAFPNDNTDCRVKKSLLVNAGDADWMVLFDPRRAPGQCAAHHNLYQQTSDEYYSLMSTFQLCSVQNGMQYNKNFIQTLNDLESYEYTNKVDNAASKMRKNIRLSSAGRLFGKNRTHKSVSALVGGLLFGLMGGGILTGVKDAKALKTLTGGTVIVGCFIVGLLLASWIVYPVPNVDSENAPVQKPQLG
jgi:hypothetical protein